MVHSEKLTNIFPFILICHHSLPCSGQCFHGQLPVIDCKVSIFHMNSDGAGRGGIVHFCHKG